MLDKMGRNRDMKHHLLLEYYLYFKVNNGYMLHLLLQ